jgi:acetate kinase
MRLLTVNAGSSSLKLRLLDDEKLVGDADVPSGSSRLDSEAIATELADWPRPDVVAHRVVHGGTRFSGPVKIDGEVEQQLRDLTDLAPLHQPKSLAGLELVSRILPRVTAVACFDTAFHTTMPDGAALYAVPLEWRRRGVRRYGFHGLSHAYASRRACQLAGIPVQGSRVITCHLGAGASLCAVADGRSIDTTMGFTPLEGLVMATRSGTVDPGLVTWLNQHAQLSVDDINETLETKSGLLALAGTADFQQVQQSAAAGDARAQTGLEVYLHRLVSGIGAMAGSLGGVDVIVFTGGVGENSEVVREQAIQRLGWLGAAVDPTRNTDCTSDTDVSTAGAEVRTVVVHAREDLQMAREIATLHLNS